MLRKRSFVIAIFIGLTGGGVSPRSTCLADSPNLELSGNSKEGTPSPEQSCHEAKIEDAKLAFYNPEAISLYRPKYLLPFYYTAKPYHQIYNGHIPSRQKLSSREVKGQLSFQTTIGEDLFNLPVDFVGAYTQTFYWQLYLESAFFRETNYEPEVFLRAKLEGWGFATIGLSHQSNGQGGKLERSWNRAYFDLQYSNGNFYVSIKPWALIFADHSSDLYNPDISKYMGYGRILAAYKKHDFTVSIMLRNHLESGFKRGTEELTLSFPKMRRFRVYLQAFRGYGQSLIEYNYKTIGGGIGLALNDWL